jgi:hypothetical protein
MRYFIASLIGAIIISVIGVGWGVTQIYSLIGDSDSELLGDLTGIKLLGGDLAASLDVMSERDEFIAQWQNQSEVSISLYTRDDFPMSVAKTLQFFCK